MSGYSDYSKSNNAVQAEGECRFPLGRAAKLAGVPKDLVKRFIRTDEWHHTSGWYNRVNYYSVREIRIVFGLEPAATDEADEMMDCASHNPEAIAALAAFKPTKVETATHTDCVVEWIEWSGSRNHPKATERRAEGCTVAVKGQTATITLPSGATLTKRLATNGFSFKAARHD